MQFGSVTMITCDEYNQIDKSSTPYEPDTNPLQSGSMEQPNPIQKQLNIHVCNISHTYNLFDLINKILYHRE